MLRGWTIKPEGDDDLSDVWYVLISYDNSWTWIGKDSLKAPLIFKAFERYSGVYLSYRSLVQKYPLSKPKKTEETKSSSTKGISRVPRAMAKSKPPWNVSGPSCIGALVSDLQNMGESRTIIWQVGTLRQSNMARFLPKAPIAREQPLPWRDKALFFLTACQQRQQNGQFGHLPNSNDDKRTKIQAEKRERWEKGKL